MVFIRYEEALPYQLQDVLNRTPIAYVPWGALEWHGEHLALGQDALKVERICELAAERTGGVVLPIMYTGYKTMQIFGMPYTLEFSDTIVRQTAIELLQQLEKAGFKCIVLLLGHYGTRHVKTIDEAVEEYRKVGKAKVIAAPEFVFAKDLGYSGDHAGKWETSIFWYLRPELVEMDRLPKDLNIPLKGVGGDDPRIHASKELGERVIKEIVEKLTKLVNDSL